MSRVKLNGEYEYTTIISSVLGTTAAQVYATPGWPVRRKVAKIDTISNTVLFFGEVSKFDIAAVAQTTAQLGYQVRPSKFAGKVAAGLKAGHSCFKLA
jgi:hypothetical protein